MFLCFLLLIWLSIDLLGPIPEVVCHAFGRVYCHSLDLLATCMLAEQFESVWGKL